jgi:SAM-dependent methyltransferase
VLQRSFPEAGEGWSLDIGIGTGYTTYRVFGQRPTICVDVDTANLRLFRERAGSVPGCRRPLCVAAAATALPFKAATFRFVLASEVFEHIEDDDAAAAELSRVLARDGTAVITVPYTGIGFTSFLDLVGVKTVHDFPGPEFHVRPGYDEASLGQLLGRHGLGVISHRYYFRFFTRIITDVVSLAHLTYQWLRHGRRSWTWADVAGAEHSLAFLVYRVAFPVLWGISRADRLLHRWRGFGLVATVQKRGTAR